MPVFLGVRRVVFVMLGPKVVLGKGNLEVLDLLSPVLSVGAIYKLGALPEHGSGPGFGRYFVTLGPTSALGQVGRSGEPRPPSEHPKSTPHAAETPPLWHRVKVIGCNVPPPVPPWNPRHHHASRRSWAAPARAQRTLVPGEADSLRVGLSKRGLGRSVVVSACCAEMAPAASIPSMSSATGDQRLAVNSSSLCLLIMLVFKSFGLPTG